MKYYFVISHKGNYYELEALANNHKIVVMKSDNTFINQTTHKTATIMEILPQNYRLSRFRDPEEHLLFKEGDQEQFLKELSDLYNKFGIDSRLNIRDFLLAEMTFNFLATINNTLNKDMELKKDSECNETETISEIVPHPEKFNPKTQPCVLTNQGIVTDVIKFD